MWKSWNKKLTPDLRSLWKTFTVNDGSYWKCFFRVHTSNCAARLNVELSLRRRKVASLKVAWKGLCKALCNRLRSFCFATKRSNLTSKKETLCTLKTCHDCFLNESDAKAKHGVAVMNPRTSPHSNKGVSHAGYPKEKNNCSKEVDEATFSEMDPQHPKKWNISATETCSKKWTSLQI